MNEYEIHRDGYVTLGAEVVGKCVTGEDGLAYVEFFDGCAPPKALFRFCAHFNVGATGFDRADLL